MLQTIPRRGYVLTTDVRRTGAARVQEGGTPAVPCLLGMLRAERTALVSVMPLHDPGTGPDGARLAHAISSDIVNELTLFEELRVVSATDAGTMFRVCGEVRLVSASLRVALRLETADGATLWATRFGVPEGDRPDVDQAEIGRAATSLARHINIEGLRQALATEPGARTARQLCLIGRELHQRGTRADTMAALISLELAIERDPEFALSYACLSYTLQRAMTHGWGHLDPASARRQSLALAQRAVQLDPSSPLSLARPAFALVLQDRWDEAVATSRAATLEARAALREVRRLQPSWDPQTSESRWLLRRHCDQQRFLAAFQIAAAH